MGSKGTYSSMHNRLGNLLGSALATANKDHFKKNINSSNEMKAQTSKCHTFSVLLFNQISSLSTCTVRTKSINYVTISRSFVVLP